MLNRIARLEATSSVGVIKKRHRIKLRFGEHRVF
jgi:hypothetical protein